MQVEASVLSAMGVIPAPGPIPIPVYAQKMLVPVQDQTISGLTVYQVTDVDDELQSLMSLLLQIVDGKAFRR
jgi:hypothetical protein